MSEQFPFLGQPSTNGHAAQASGSPYDPAGDAPTATLPRVETERTFEVADEDAREHRSRDRLALIVLAALAAAVLAFGAWWLLFHGSGNGDETAAGSAAPTTSTESKPAGSDGTKPAKPADTLGGAKLPADFHGKLGRNPFKPLYAAPAAAGAGGGGGNGSDGTASGGASPGEKHSGTSGGPETSGSQSAAPAGTSAGAPAPAGQSAAGSTAPSTGQGSVPPPAAVIPVHIWLTGGKGNTATFEILYGDKRVEYYRVPLPSGPSGTPFADGFTLKKVTADKAVVQRKGHKPFSLGSSGRGHQLS